MDRTADGLIILYRDEILEGLRSGKTLIITRRDSPVYRVVLEMEREGLLNTELRQPDYQSSYLKVTLGDCNT